MRIGLKRFGNLVLFLVLINSVVRAGDCAEVKLSGLYRGFPAVAQFGASTGEAYVFSGSGGGDVYRGWIGTQSPATFDFARARVTEPDKTGKYVANGDKIIFRWSNGQSENVSFRYTCDAKGEITMSVGSLFFYKIVAWGKFLDGTFSPATYQGGFNDLKPQVPAIVDQITFTPNGNFTITEDSGKTTTGHYKVLGGMLTLLLSNNETRVYSLHVFTNGKTPPNTVLIDGRPFNKS